MEDEDGNNMEDTSGFEKSALQLVVLGVEDLMSVF